MKEIWKAILLITISLMIVACSNGNDVSEKLVHHLEKTIEIENDFIENQDKIYQLEKEDEQLYQEIIHLGSDDYEKIVELSEEAIALLDERLEYVKLEKISMDDSRKEFEQIEPIIEEIAHPEQKEQVKKMYDTMMNRYASYDKVYGHYSESVQLTKELYILFQEAEAKGNEVYNAIAMVNESYDDVVNANEAFNRETIVYNNLKEEYYTMLYGTE